MKKIAIIEDDRSINQGIRLTLGEQNYCFRPCYTLAEAAAKDISDADLIILDLNLPDGNGLDFLQEIRKTSTVPVLILTANDTEMDEVTGLQLGADDYVTKPFSLMVLRLRVERLLNRNRSAKSYVHGSLEFDFEQMKFFRGQKPLELSKTEIRLLYILLENEGRIMTRERLLDYIWQGSEFVEENALSVTVKRLRDKIETKTERYITTSYGVGYMWKW